MQFIVDTALCRIVACRMNINRAQNFQIVLCIYIPLAGCWSGMLLGLRIRLKSRLGDTHEPHLGGVRKPNVIMLGPDPDAGQPGIAA
jgi:hypothetical protein